MKRHLALVLPIVLAVTSIAAAADSQGAAGGITSWTGPPARIEGCEEKLRAAGVRFRSFSWPVRRRRAGIECGIDQGVVYRRGPGGIRWNRPPRLSCAMALGLARLETVVQEEARRHLGGAVARIVHAGTYNCREMANYPGWVSEHSFANAIDLERFVLAGGRAVEIRKHYGAAGPAATREGRFLGAVARRLYDENVFSVVLTPAFDDLHRSHFHLDDARYRVDGTGTGAQPE